MELIRQMEQRADTLKYTDLPTRVDSFTFGTPKITPDGFDIPASDVPSGVCTQLVHQDVPFFVAVTAPL